ncbi:MAG: AI-2E family transporter [Acidobacteria bacterium]|nr:AI-2E family transporter [Acidobacteriota bacterium]
MAPAGPSSCYPSRSQDLMNLDLSERQRATVGVALTILAACVILAAVGFVFWLLAKFVAEFSSVIMPLAVAAIAALVFKPYFDLLQRRLRLPPALAVAAVFASILVPLGAFAWFFGAKMVSQGNDVAARLPELIDAANRNLRAQLPEVIAFFERHGLDKALDSAIEGGRKQLVDGLQTFGSGALSAGAGVLSFVGSALSWVVLPVYFGFFLMADGWQLDRLKKHLPFLKPDTRDDVVYLIQQFVDIIVAFFRGQIIIAFLQGLLFAVGFSIVGLQYGFLIGLALGFLNIIPYLGNIVGLSVALPLALLQPEGGWVRVGLALIVFAIVQTIEGYFLTPKIMGERTGLHPMAIIVAIFFWGTALSGILGMILAIPLTAFLVVFWRLAKEKYVQELV